MYINFGRMIRKEAVRIYRSFSTNQKGARPFEEIPGPKPMPLIGTAWKYMPVIGDYSLKEMHKTNEKKMNEFGSIVREEVVPGVYVVSVFDPGDIEQVYKSEGKFPARRSHLAVEHYRASKQHIYKTGGLLPTNGEEWWRIRSAFQKSLSKIQNVRQFLPITDGVIRTFLNRYLCDGEVVEDFQELAARLGLELTWTVMFGERLHQTCPGYYYDLPSQLIQAAESVNCSILTTDNTEHIWKKWKTKSYRNVETNLSFIERVVLSSLNRKRRDFDMENDDNWKSKGLLGQYFKSQGVDFKDITGMAVDLMLGGIDTTSYTLSFLAWHLTQNPSVQEKLAAEAVELLPNVDSIVTGEALNNAQYTRAVLKETFRLNPIAIGISRILAEDTILSGYLVPKNSLVITQNMVACRQAKYFKDPLKFCPERWVKGSDDFVQISPYLILPFSHGPRTCIARRLAEQNLMTLILHIAKTHRLFWRGNGELGVVTPLICKPDRPVKILVQKTV